MNPAISRDLSAVVATAIEKDRDRRYQTALDFATDLRRVLDRVPVLARRTGPLRAAPPVGSAEPRRRDLGRGFVILGRARRPRDDAARCRDARKEAAAAGSSASRTSRGCAT